jgi:hypothetical protein
MTHRIEHRGGASLLLRLAGLIVYMTLLLLLAGLTINKYAPQYLHADVILFSVMSLQKITLFYWGQDRLLNVVPFIASIIRDPKLNLSLILLIHSTVFYFCILIWSQRALKSVCESPKLSDRIQIFVICLAIVFAALTPYAIFEFSITHIEYSLSYLLLALACSLFENKVFKSQTIIMIFILLLFATAMNNSIILPSLMIAAVDYFERKKFDARIFTFAISATASFIIWGLISKTYGQNSLSYTTISFVNFDDKLLKVAISIGGVVNLTAVLIFSLFFTIKIIFSTKTLTEKFNKNQYYYWFFLISWLLFFPANRWVEINAFNFRYFAPVMFIPLMMTAIIVHKSAENLTIIFRGLFLTVLILFIGVNLRAPNTSIDDYNIFDENNSLFIKNENNNKIIYFSGDYWKAWPAVMNQMLRGSTSYGFAYRSQGNIETLRKAANTSLRDSGAIEVYCLNDTLDNCKEQVFFTIKNLYLDNVSELSPKKYLLTFKSNINQN